MAKGQMRTNREIRKLKKDKTATVTAAPSGSQVKFVPGNATASSKK